MDVDPDRKPADDGGDGPERPLAPPPTLSELFDVFLERVALRHPSFDATRAVLAVAALVGLGGMAWALTANRNGQHRAAPIRIETPSTTTTTTAAVTTTRSEPLVVDVAGAVVRPGPVRVAHDARVADAIAAAGGVRGDADLERVDRAATLGDGQRVYVPHRGQSEIPEVVGATGPSSVGGDPGASASGPAAAAAGSATAVVNLNTADAAALDTLPGVGPATAQAIIDHRTRNGPFASVDELLEVKGIGPAKLADLRSRVTV
jgi:competence protein ComEA